MTPSFFVEVNHLKTCHISPYCVRAEDGSVPVQHLLGATQITTQTKEMARADDMRWGRAILDDLGYHHFRKPPYS